MSEDKQDNQALEERENLRRGLRILAKIIAREILAGKVAWPDHRGACFAIPAIFIVLALSWAYVRYGTTPQAEWISYGIKPVVIGIILWALWQLGRKAIKDKATALAVFSVIGLYFLGINEIALLFGGALAVMLIKNVSRLNKRSILGLFLPLAGSGVSVAAAKAFSFPLLFFTFLKIGSVLYGSGFVLLAYFKADFVTRFGWITDQQLIDAIAIGQVTPGPFFTSATFIGYILGGFKGLLWQRWEYFYLPSLLLRSRIRLFHACGPHRGQEGCWMA